MTTDIKPFDFHGQTVRTLTDVNGEPWFVAKDVCEILGTHTKDVRSILDDDEVTNVTTIDIGGISTIYDPSNGGKAPLIVSEAGLYTLIMRSRKPEAQTFKRWVTHEVLPSIRKTGGYAMSSMSVEERALSIMGELKAIVDRQKRTITCQHEAITQMEPKAEAYDTFLDHTGLYKVGEAAKLLSNSGTSIGQKRLFDFMESIGWIYRNHGKWTAKQRQVDAGHLYMKDHVTNGTDSNGNPFQYPPTVYVTRRGLNLLQRKLADRNLERTLAQSPEQATMIENA